MGEPLPSLEETGFSIHRLYSILTSIYSQTSWNNSCSYLLYYLITQWPSTLHLAPVFTAPLKLLQIKCNKNLLPACIVQKTSGLISLYSLRYLIIIASSFLDILSPLPFRDTSLSSYLCLLSWQLFSNTGGAGFYSGISFPTSCVPHEWSSFLGLF